MGTRGTPLQCISSLVFYTWNPTIVTTSSVIMEKSIYSYCVPQVHNYIKTKGKYNDVYLRYTFTSYTFVRILQLKSYYCFYFKCNLKKYNITQCISEIYKFIFIYKPHKNVYLRYTFTSYTFVGVLHLKSKYCFYFKCNYIIIYNKIIKKK